MNQTSSKGRKNQQQQSANPKQQAGSSNNTNSSNNGHGGGGAGTDGDRTPYAAIAAGGTGNGAGNNFHSQQQQPQQQQAPPSVWGAPLPSGITGQPKPAQANPSPPSVNQQQSKEGATMENNPGSEQGGGAGGEGTGGNQPRYSQGGYYSQHINAGAVGQQPRGPPGASPGNPAGQHNWRMNPAPGAGPNAGAVGYYQQHQAGPQGSFIPGGAAAGSGGTAAAATGTPASATPGQQQQQQQHHPSPHLPHHHPVATSHPHPQHPGAAVIGMGGAGGSQQMHHPQQHGGPAAPHHPHHHHPHHHPHQQHHLQGMHRPGQPAPPGASAGGVVPRGMVGAGGYGGVPYGSAAAAAAAAAAQGHMMGPLGAGGAGSHHHPHHHGGGAPGAPPPPPPPPPPPAGPPGSAGPSQVVGGGSTASTPSSIYTPRPKKPLVITDKHGNVVDFSAAKAKKAASASNSGGGGESSKPQSSLAAAASAGAKLRAAAERAIQSDRDAEKERKEAKLKAEREEAEKQRAEREAAEKLRQAEEEEKKRKEEAERKRIAEEQARKKKEEEEERKRKEKEEEELRQRLEEEEQRRRKVEEEKLARAKKAAEEKRKKEEQEKAAAARAAEEARRRAVEEEEAAKKIREEQAARRKAAAAVASERSNRSPPSSAGRGGTLQSRLERMAATPSALSEAGAPSGGGGPSLRPGGMGLRPGGLRPGLAPGASGAPGGSAGAGLRPGGASSGGAASLRPGGGMVTPGSAGADSRKRLVYSKQELLKFKELPYCCSRPDDLPDQTVRLGGSAGGRQSGRGGGGKGGDQWMRGAPSGQNSNGRDGGRRPGGGSSGEWDRGQPMPKPPRDRGGDRRGGPRGGPPMPFFDGPVKPITRSEGRWIPTPDTSALVKAEKAVKAILNKMTKSNFEKLTRQFFEIPVPSYEVLTMMIHRVFEKAIDEPSFGDMYADLCVRLSKDISPDSFLHVIEERESGETTKYRWSSNVNTTDSEIVGPLESADECLRVAMDAENAPDPVKRGERELELVELLISDGRFIKIMADKDSGEEGDFYVVFFNAADAKTCGQELSEKEFTSKEECYANAKKMNSFKRSLLNKCEDEFTKQDIYVDWKREKKQYESEKSKMTEAERAEKEEEFEFKRMKIKKQMLGNIRFIGELYKKGMLKEGIMHVCIRSLMKMEEVTTRDGKQQIKPMEDDEMDEEDHEALCQLFTTIGSTIDHAKSQAVINEYFNKFNRLSNDKRLSSRSRFMYKDLIDLRRNRWRARRQEEKAKTIAEIRKDAAREERAAQQQQQQQNTGQYRGGGGDRRDREPAGRSGRQGDYRGDRADPRRGGGSYVGGSSRGGVQNSPYTGSRSGGDRRKSAQPKEVLQSDGFTQVVRGGRGPAPSGGAVTRSGSVRESFSTPSRSQGGRQEQQKGRSSRSPTRSPPPVPVPAALDPEKLKLRIQNILREFVSDENEKELLLSVDELSGTPEAYQKLVEIIGEKVLDCKDAERPNTLKLLLVLAQKGKVSSDDFENGLGTLVEFIDDMKMDIPKVYKYMGALLSALMNVDAVRVSWLVQQCGVIDSEFAPNAPGDLIQSTVSEMKSEFGAEAVTARFGPEKAALVDLLGADKWNQIME